MKPWLIILGILIIWTSTYEISHIVGGSLIGYGAKK